MFDDARFYNRLAENTESYGRAKCSDSAMFLAISRLDFDDDLLSAMDDPDAYLLDETDKMAA
ncbi:MAG: hypothetical protein IJG87_07285 [Ruminococcus sp.]|nr:hypothetical protein [Ruminococcus sp.]